jgi:hypothetical protein
MKWLVRGKSEGRSPHAAADGSAVMMLQWAEEMKSGKSLELRTCRASLIWHLCRKRAGKKLGEIT